MLTWEILVKQLIISFEEIRGIHAMKKIFKVLFVSLLFAGIAACGGGDSSSEDNAADVTVTTPDGVAVTFASDEATVNEVFELFFNLGGDQLTGTIFWGDNTTTRVRGSGTASHIYRGSGTVTIAIQIDGQAAEGVANITVLPATPVEQSTESVSSDTQTSVPTASMPTTGTLSIPTCNADFFGVGGSGIGNIQFDSFSGQVSSSESNASLAGITVQAIAMINSTTSGETQFILLGSATTDATGNFSRTIPSQSQVNFPNANFASVQTFFGFSQFDSFNFNASISECNSIDTNFTPTP